MHTWAKVREVGRSRYSYYEKKRQNCKRWHYTRDRARRQRRPARHDSQPNATGTAPRAGDARTQLRHRRGQRSHHWHGPTREAAWPVGAHIARTAAPTHTACDTRHLRIPPISWHRYLGGIAQTCIPVQHARPPSTQTRLRLTTHAWPRRGAPLPHNRSHSRGTRPPSTRRALTRSSRRTERRAGPSRRARVARALTAR